MLMKNLLLPIIVLFLLISLVSSAACANIQLSVSVREQEPLVTKLGTIHVGMLKKNLYKIFNKEFERDYRKEDNKEWITFFDWTTEAVLDDIITFYIMDRKVMSWFKGSISDMCRDTSEGAKSDISVQPKIPEYILEMKSKTDKPGGGWVTPTPIKSNEK